MPRILLLASPRTGSSYLGNLLSSHPQIEILRELLNEEENIPKPLNPILYIEEQLSMVESQIAGFKVFPSQIRTFGLKFNHLVDSLNITNVIVIWRKNLLELYSSLQISLKTGVWATAEEGILSNCEVEIYEANFKKWFQEFQNDWKTVGSEWPVRIKPIFVEYEELVRNPSKVCNNILYELSLEQIGERLFCWDKKANTSPVQKRIKNWGSLAPYLQILELDIKKLVEEEIKKSVHISSEAYELAPDREPPSPVNGYRYTVAEPFIPIESKEHVYECVESGMISSAGPWPTKLAKLLKDTFETNGIVQPCANGFVALVIVLQAAGIKPGDEIICPSLTMIAVPNAITFVGATPIFADSSSSNYNSSLENILTVVSRATKGIILTHTYGVPTPNISQILEYCLANNLWLIEDISEAVGIRLESNNNEKPYLGTFGHFACASLYANKIVHGGDGGFVISKDPIYGPKLRSLVNHGFTPSYHFVHYEAALNGKMTGMSAAMAYGVVQNMDHIMSHRSWLCSKYRQLLSDPAIPLGQMMNCGYQDTPWVFGVECSSKNERTKLRAYLAQHGIETRDYFFPLHLQPVYYKQNQRNNSYPNAEKFGSTGFYLPTHTNLTEEDAVYIISCIKSFYSCSNPPILPERNFNHQTCSQLVIPSGKFEVDVKNLLNKNGTVNSDQKYALIEAVDFCTRIKNSLISNKWDVQQLLVEEFNELYKKLEVAPLYQTEFFNSNKPIIDYIEAYKKFETPIEKPWLEIDLNDPLFQQSFFIPTTSDPETIQLILWLIQQYKPKVIWEIGTLLGHATVRIAAQVNECKINEPKIYAFDLFQWQLWMDDFVGKDYCDYLDGESFIDLFLKNIGKYSNIIEPIVWSDTEPLPEQTTHTKAKPQLIYLDITHQAEELESLWKIIVPQLIEDETIIVFNGVLRSSLTFFTNHKDELKLFIGKPSTIAMAYLYSKTLTTIQEDSDPIITNEGEDDDVISYPFETKLNFHKSPTWTHHHQNCFGQAMEALAQELHDNNSTTYFIPAVEETICDYPELVGNNPWIGIIHTVVNAPELFYTSDLYRLCSKRFDQAMKNCKGLITLTSTQAEYLRKHLKYKIPIQFIHYPIIKPSILSSTNIWNLEKINFVLIGTFVRDISLFYSCTIPSQFSKVLLVGDEEGKLLTKNCPETIVKLDRLPEEDYENLLLNSVVFLSLEHEGAANTIVVECMARNIPILLPNIASCTDYIGKNYPLLYDWKIQTDFNSLLTVENIKAAIKYLEEMDKSFLSIESFVSKVKGSAVLRAVTPQESTWPNFDVTISITSFKRTHNLAEILDSLWNNQSFTGTFQIIVWNNNAARSELVRQICKPYIERSGQSKKLEMIDSTRNYYCSIRLALASLMKSDKLIICDDDIIPNSNFINFFLEAHKKYPNDVLCIRGHKFAPHELDYNEPTKAWHEYENLQFLGDEENEEFIHFVHADACCIPKQLLHEACSIPMPDPTFTLVDDYWMCFVLNHYFGRMLRKLKCSAKEFAPCRRTLDSDTVGLALYTRKEVQEARDRLYIHHMLHGWPNWDGDNEIIDETQKSRKMEFWSKYFLGMNISSSITLEEIQELQSMGITAVRIGAVGINGIGPGYYGEFEELRTNLTIALENLKKTINELGEHGISVLLTIPEPYATPLLWKSIAKELGNLTNVVGYDVINEPFLQNEHDMHWAELKDIQPNGLPKELERYIQFIETIRKIDPYTPIVIEPSFWGHIDATRLLPLGRFIDFDNIIVSFHFYEPRNLTQIRQNKNLEYNFPGEIPIYTNVAAHTIHWDAEYIYQKFKSGKEWAESFNRRIFVGEFGIHRSIPGAPEYLEAIKNVCKKLEIPGFLFSFKDKDWDAHRYDFGPDQMNFSVIQEDLVLENRKNPFMNILKG